MHRGTGTEHDWNGTLISSERPKASQAHSISGYSEYSSWDKLLCPTDFISSLKFTIAKQKLEVCVSQTFLAASGLCPQE